MLLTAIGCSYCPSLLPLWSLGYIQSKCTYHDWDETDDAIHQIRLKGIPLDSIVFDFDWAEHMMNFTWYPRWKGLSKERIAEHGGAWIAFRVVQNGSNGNHGSSYREEQVNLGITDDSGGGLYLVGLKSGAWLEYTVNIPESGRYAVSLRITSAVKGSLSVWVDERNLSGGVRYEGQGEGTWFNVTNSEMVLPEGEHIIRFQVDQVRTGS